MSTTCPAVVLIRMSSIQIDPNRWQFQQLLGSRDIPVHNGVTDFEDDLRTPAQG